MMLALALPHFAGDGDGRRKWSDGPERRSQGWPLALNYPKARARTVQHSDDTVKLFYSQIVILRMIWIVIKKQFAMLARRQTSVDGNSEAEIAR